MGQVPSHEREPGRRGRPHRHEQQRRRALRPAEHHRPDPDRPPARRPARRGQRALDGESDSGSPLRRAEGSDHLIWADPDPIFDLVEEFVTGVPPAAVPDRVLVTVLFTDIVGSTETAAAAGDEAWRRLLDRHDETVRRYLQRYRGREVKSTGDGFLAVFDGPRAVRCAQAISRRSWPSGSRSAGLHTGEVELRGDDIGGVAVHAAARIAALAGPGMSWPRGRSGT